MKNLFLFFFICASYRSMAQNSLSPKAIKQLETAVELYKKGQIQKAIDKTRKVLDVYPSQTSIWDLMAEMHQENVTQAKSSFNNTLDNFLMDAVNIKKSKKARSKSMLDGLKPFLDAQFGFDNFMREATLHSRSSIASLYLRSSKVDAKKPDSLVGDEALKLYNKGENYFRNGSYSTSLPYYHDAIEKANGKYFSAELSLGDAHYMLEEYDSATKYYTQCASHFPQYIEPHKFLADSYSQQREFEKAIESCINTILIYPDVSIFSKLENSGKFLRKKYNDGWMVRGVYPYSKTTDHLEAVGAWNDYIIFSKKAWDASDSLGVINNPASFENEKYAEVYAWRKMLQNDGGNSPELAFARKMRDTGYLDCYVFISLFHYDLLPSYRHFVANNSDKAATYLREVVVSK